MRPAYRPNYALRRAVAATIVLLLVYGLIRVVGSVFGGNGDAKDDVEAAGAGETTTTTVATTTTTAAPLPACVFGDVPTELASAEDWQRTIVDTERAVPADYVPPGLTTAGDAGFASRYEVREIIIEDLARLREGAKANGTPVELIAAYRSIDDQSELFDSRVEEFGFDRAAARTSRPGHSEHHLGTTVDFKTEGAADVFQSWADEPTGQWVMAHAHEYGFVLSYPLNAKDTTCYDFEPWHYRYVGVEMAAKVQASGLTLREYLWQWQQAGKEPTGG